MPPGHTRSLNRRHTLMLGLALFFAGTAAFAYFKWRGQMSHSLTEPIPGAPALPTFGDWKPAGQRLRAAIARFQAFNGVLQPHFAYGVLDKAAYTRAHLMHLANHWQAFHPATAQA